MLLPFPHLILSGMRHMLRLVQKLHVVENETFVEAVRRVVSTLRIESTIAKLQDRSNYEEK